MKLSSAARGPDTPFVSDSQLNGKPLSRLSVTQQEISGGGELTFQMTGESRQKSYDCADLPFSMSQRKR